MTPSHHRCHVVSVALACHSTLHTLATVLMLQPISGAKWILTHYLTLIILALFHCHSDRLGCNINGGVYSALIYTWGRIFSTISRFCHRSMRLAIFALESSARSAILSEVLADCCPSCDWLQQSRTPHKTMIGPVMDFPHASPAVTQQPSNALLRVFELAHGVNFTKSMSICSDVACGCGYRVYLWRP